MPQRAIGWHPETIKAEIRIRRGTVGAFARHIGVTHRAIQMTISDPTRSARLELLIAAELGQKPHVLWPDRWSAKGERLPRPRRIRAPQGTPRHRQIREAT